MGVIMHPDKKIEILENKNYRLMEELVEIRNLIDAMVKNHIACKKAGKMLSREELRLIEKVI